MAPQKRTATEAEAVLDGVKAALIDIEGTTTPISFVKHILFPYVTANLKTYLEKHFAEDSCLADVQCLRLLAKNDKEAKVDGVVEIPDKDASKDGIIQAVIANVKWQMSQDRKTLELKQIQGRVWKEAYKQGKIKGELFSDVIPALRQMVDDGIKLYIYSSGSIESQKLLFSHSPEGDIVDLFSGFFDTTSGNKLECSSYKKITEEMDLQADEIIFLTDNPKEAAAAAMAGLRCNLVIRSGNAELSEEDRMKYATIKSFCELVKTADKKRTSTDKECVAEN